MQDLQVEPLDIKYLSLYEAWFDQRAANYSLFKQSKLQDISSHNSWAWAGRIANEVVAVALFHLDDMRKGRLNIAVKPSERRHGIGAKLTDLILKEPALKNSTSIFVSVEPENIAGQKILVKNGFSKVDFNEEGLIDFVKQKF